MSIIGIVAVARNFAIGKDGKLPWQYSEDLKFFKRTTMRNAVVMGYHTWISIGKPLPKRLNIVLSGKSRIEGISNVISMRGKDEVLSLSNYLNCDIYVMGGAKTYASFSDEIEKWIVTEIPIEVEDADAFIPENYLDGFELIDSEERAEDLKVKKYKRLR